MTRTVSVDSICIMAHLLFSFSCSIVYFLKGMRRARPTRAHLERLSCAPQTAALRRPRHDANPLGKKFLGTGTRGNPRQASTSVSDATRGKNKNIFTHPAGLNTKAHESRQSRTRNLSVISVVQSRRGSLRQPRNTRMSRKEGPGRGLFLAAKVAENPKNYNEFEKADLT